MTGEAQIPLGQLRQGFIKVDLDDNSTLPIDTQLPISHTCTNQLILFRYSSREILEQKLLLAIEHGTTIENE